MSQKNEQNRTIVSKEVMLETLEKTLGIVTDACRICGVSRTMHYEWLKTDKQYKKAVKEIENVALDFAESHLHKQIAKGNPLSTMFYLKCRGKKRGYIEQQEVKLTGNMKFKAEFGEGNPIQPTSETEDNT